MKTKLFVLISTIDNRILNLNHILQSQNENICYVVSHQVTHQQDQKNLNFIDEISKREDVYYMSLDGTGVAKNRNNALLHIKPSSICLILDDDVMLYNDTFETVMRAFNENRSADFISFKILDLQGNDYKPYPSKSQWHSLRTLTGIGTTEMAFRSDLIINTNVKFDESFGPGSDKYPIGEDFIFAMDLYKLKTRMFFISIALVKHPQESTGNRFDEKIIFGRGAMFARVFGWKAFLINVIFSIKKYSQYHNHISFYKYILLLTRGSVDYLNVSRMSEK